MNIDKTKITIVRREEEEEFGAEVEKKEIKNMERCKYLGEIF